jgi:DNA-binding transcriptional MerR regulator
MPRAHDSNAPGEATFTTRVAAEVAGVHQQTVIRWAKEGFLKPSVSRRKYEPREYTERDLAALMLANIAFDVGLPRKDVAEMVKMAQKGSEKQLKKASIGVFEGIREYKGFVRQVWFSGKHAVDDSNSPEVLGFDRQVRVRGEKLYDIVQRMLEAVQERYVKKGFADTEEPYRPEARGEEMSSVRRETSEELEKGREKAQKAK